jgi:hypothetical protein
MTAGFGPKSLNIEGSRCKRLAVLYPLSCVSVTTQFSLTSAVADCLGTGRTLSTEVKSLQEGLFRMEPDSIQWKGSGDRSIKFMKFNQQSHLSSRRNLDSLGRGGLPEYVNHAGIIGILFK